MIEVREISKYYGALRALHRVSFQVARGEVLGFLGPNGAGKSTTMKILTTYISASSGTARIDGYDVHAHPREVCARIGYLPETPPLYTDMTVEAYLLFAARARGLSGHEARVRLEQTAQATGLSRRLATPILELSKGYKQRVGLAQALIHDPPVLILDEPTSGLDPGQIIEIRRLIERLRNEGKAVVFSTHILQEAAAVADRLVIVNNGDVVADGTADQLAEKVSGGRCVKVLLRGSFAGLEGALREIPQVERVETEHPPEGFSRFVLSTGGGLRGAREVCEKVAALAASRGLGVAELAPDRMSLEDVFLGLLRGRGDESAKGPEKAEPGEKAAVAVSGSAEPADEEGGEG